ncbi:MAG: amidohydrolase [Clostridia bacterium]|nr:amidohydrolase [Clostridia bacterium]
MKNIVSAVDKYRELIFKVEREVWNNPETGYREWKTSNYIASEFEKLGYSLIKADNIPGFYTIIDTGRPGPEVLVLGELDSLICGNHPESDKETGYVHACGHNAQLAALVGIAGALKDEKVLSELSGRIRLCAVPAEEMIEIGYRTELQNKGVIKYFGGKTEFLHRGYFDGVDIAFMVHSSSKCSVSAGAVGCIAKTIHYKGIASHAGSSPWNGKNALYAATQGLAAVNALRETFKESDLIRFHPIITHGGNVVNAIPELVTIETYVRGASFEGILNANKKINQALIGSALSIGVQIDIVDKSGYAPLINSEELIEVFEESANKIIPEENFVFDHCIGTGSTDMGDLSLIMPAIHPRSSGTTGISHGADYQIADHERVCVKSAKWQLMALNILLKDGAKRAKEIIANFKPTFSSKEEYLNYVDKINKQGDRIVYSENKAEIILD